MDSIQGWMKTKGQGEVSQMRELVRAEMCGAYDLDPALGVDVGVGDNWADAKS